MLLGFFLFLISSLDSVAGVAPTIDLSHNMRILKLPQDTAVGSVIYRLRGSDPDNDVLTFGVRGDTGNQLLDIRAVTETRANVILKSSPTEREYKLTIYVTDGTQTTEIESTILITNSTNQKSAFLQYDPLITVSELTGENEVIGTVVVRKRNSSSLPVLFEVEGSDKFVIRYVISPLKEASKAEISILQKLDYEKKNLFRLAIYALNPWTDEQFDTRNVAVVDVLVAVKDAQDTPPVFQPRPPVVKISDNLALGDNVTQLIAEDGDYGNQRNITYGFVPGSTATSYFNIHSRTGMITLATTTERMRETYSTSGPFVLSIQATEVESDAIPGLPQSSQSTIAIVLVNTENRPPRFFSRRYVASVEENSPFLTALTWEGSAIPRVMDDDQGKNGSFELYLEGDGGAFSIQPSRGMNELNFALLVKDPSTLDYEKSDTKYIEFKIVARETSSVRPLSTTAEIRVKLTDANDNIPQFTHDVYNVTLSEDAGPGTVLVKIQATDEDTGSFGTVRYTAVNGPIAGVLRLDPLTGDLTLISGEGLDRERVPEYTLTVEARDDQGKGNRNAAEVRVMIADANDNAPVFLQPRYDAVLNPDMKNFYEPLRVQAYDADGPGPNSNITYEIVNGNYQEKFVVEPQTGEIRLRAPLLADQDSPRDHGVPVITLTVRAHDQGVPVQFATVKVQVHNQEYLNRSISFIVPISAKRASERKQELERGFSTLSGAHVNVHSVAFHNTSQEKSIVRCWVSYPLSSTVDLSNMDVIIGHILGREYYLATSKVESINKSNFDVVFWLLIALVILMILAILALFFYCCCVRATDGRDILEMKNKIVPEENIIHYKEEGAVQLNNDARRRSNSRTRENWTDNRRSQQLALKNRVSTDEGEGSSPHHRAQQTTVHIGEPITTTYAQAIAEEDGPTRGGYLPNGIPVVAGGRMERAYRRGRPLSPTAQLLAQEVAGDITDARRLGNYVVVRKVVRPRVHVDTVDGMDDGEDGPRRTEILYIRSPMREDEEERHYIREGELLRSVSETALNVDDPHLRVPRTYRVRPQPPPPHHRGIEIAEGPSNQQLKFSRYHRTEGDVIVSTEEDELPNPPVAAASWGPPYDHPSYAQQRLPPQQQYDRWEGQPEYLQRHPSLRHQQIEDYRMRMEPQTYPGPQRLHQAPPQPQYHREQQQPPPPPHPQYQREQQQAQPQLDYHREQQQQQQQQPQQQEEQEVPFELPEVVQRLFPQTLMNMTVPNQSQTTRTQSPEPQQRPQDEHREWAEERHRTHEGGEHSQWAAPDHQDEHTEMSEREDIDDDSKTVIMGHGARIGKRFSIAHPPDVQDFQQQTRDSARNHHRNSMAFHETQNSPLGQEEPQQEQSFIEETQALEQEDANHTEEVETRRQSMHRTSLRNDSKLEEPDAQDSNQPETDIVDSRETQDESDRLFTEDSRTTAHNKQSTEDEVSTRTDQNVASDGEEDSDSGIGKDGTSLRLKKSNLMEKKSLFTIAYDGMQTRGLKSAGGRDDSP